MHKQFLLRPDGSIPEGTDVALLNQLGIPLVVPTAPPDIPGMMPVEQDPQQDENGVWHQVWTVVPEPPETPEE